MATLDPSDASSDGTEASTQNTTLHARILNLATLNPSAEADAVKDELRTLTTSMLILSIIKDVETSNGTCRLITALDYVFPSEDATFSRRLCILYRRMLKQVVQEAGAISW